MKTEFLVQLDGVSASAQGRILVIGATNRPFDLDEAALRRMTKRIYIGLPDSEARFGQIDNMIKEVEHTISEEELMRITNFTDGYSSADIAVLVKDACFMPLKELPHEKILDMKKEDLRAINVNDFAEAARTCRPSVQPETIQTFKQWHDKNNVS